MADTQLPSADETDLDSIEGVEDDAAQNDSSAGNYVIDSYGADYTVDSLVNRMEKGAFLVPDFQRRFVWSKTHASRFIESLLMGLPVPGIFLYKRSEDSKHLVIDGQQRLRSLQAFYKGMFNDRKFRLTGIRDPWNGKSYDELGADDQLRLDDSIVHTTIFSQKSPKDEIDSVHFVFERINSGGIRLSPQEIRNCISQGPFTKAIRKMNENTDWRAIYGPESVRAKDEELILRSLAMYISGDNYERPMSGFLTKFADEMNRSSSRKTTLLEKQFGSVVQLVNQSLGNRAFRPIKSLNAAVLDSVMAALLHAEKKGELPTKKDFIKQYDRLIKDDDFELSWSKATANEDSVTKRLRIAKDFLAT